MPHSPSSTPEESSRFANVGTAGRKPNQKETKANRKKLAKAWNTKLDEAVSTMGEFVDDIEHNRMYVRGAQKPGQEVVRANLIHAHVRRTINQEYARNPAFSIRPIESVNPSSYRKWRLFGKTAEIVLNRAFTDAHLKRRAKACLRSAKTSRLGWMKVTYQTDINRQPLSLGRQRDAEDQIRQIELLKKKSKDPETVAEHDRHLLELKNARDEATVEDGSLQIEGLVCDVVDPTNIILDLSTIQNFDDYTRVPFIAEGFWMTMDNAKKLFMDGKDMPSGTEMFDLRRTAYETSKGNRGRGSKAHKSEGKFEEGGNLVRIYEIWDKESKLVHTMAKGAEDFLRDPYRPDMVGEHWYPYFPLAQNIVDGQFMPLSDVELLKDLQEEHDTARTNFRDHRDIARPHWVGNSNSLTKKDAKKFAMAQGGDVTMIDGPVGQPITNTLAPATHPPIDPSVYTTDHLKQDIQDTVGGLDATQPQNNKSRTLGEAELLNADVSQNATANTDEIEDWFEEIAHYALQILLQRLNIEDVVKIAGPQAVPDEETGELGDGSVWPELGIEEIFNMVKLNIQAGSSGRPGREREMQVWSQFLLPRITELIQAVSTVRETGQNDLAKALIRVGKETFRRFDERFDVEEFLPQDDVDNNPEQPDDPAARAAEQQNQLQEQQMLAQKAEMEAKFQASQQEQQDKMALEQAKLQQAADTKRQEIEVQLQEIAVEQEKIAAEQQQAAADIQFKELELEAKRAEFLEELDSKEEIERMKAAVSALSSQSDGEEGDKKKADGEQLQKQIADSSKQIAEVVKTLNKPKKVAVSRDSEGRLSGATVSAGK